MARMSAEERRESVILAAVAEFARGGYNATSTEAIAKRVGVSQPYLFRLFPSKQAMFLAASDRCLADTRKVFAEAGDGLEGEEARQAMAAAYQRLIVDDPDKLLLQMQMYAAIAAAEAAGDHEFGESVRAAGSRCGTRSTSRSGPISARPRHSSRTACSSTPWPRSASHPTTGSGPVSIPRRGRPSEQCDPGSARFSAHQS